MRFGEAEIDGESVSIEELCDSQPDLIAKARRRIDPAQGDGYATGRPGGLGRNRHAAGDPIGGEAAQGARLEGAGIRDFEGSGDRRNGDRVPRPARRIRPAGGDLARSRRG